MKASLHHLLSVQNDILHWFEKPQKDYYKVMCIILLKVIYIIFKSSVLRPESTNEVVKKLFN